MDPRRARAETVQDVIQRQGAKLGYSLPQAMQMMGGITQAGGGVGRELGTQQLGLVGMAAQRAYGIGPEVTGAFLQGGRRGGVVGNDVVVPGVRIVHVGEVRQGLRLTHRSPPPHCGSRTGRA